MPAWFDADQQLGRLLSEEDEEPGHDEEEEEEPESIQAALGKPCSPGEIDQLEARLGRSLPGSYRAYLTLYGSGRKSFGAPLGPAEHRSRALRQALLEKSGLFDELERSNPLAAGAIPFIADGDSRKLVLFVPPVRKIGEMDVVDYDIVEEQHRDKDLDAYFRRALSLTRELVAKHLKARTRRGIVTVRHAIDAVLAFSTTGAMSKTAPKKPIKPGDASRAWWLGVLNSALQATFSAKQLELCARLADLARPHVRANSYLPHNAACAFAAVRRYDDALEMCRVAVEIGYAHLDRLETDTDLGPLLRRRDFKALFT